MWLVVCSGYLTLLRITYKEAVFRGKTHTHTHDRQFLGCEGGKGGGDIYSIAVQG